MLISRFGDTYAGAQVLPNALPVDNWQVRRGQAIRKVPNTSGVFDFSGTAAGPFEPMTVRKSFMVENDDPVWSTGTGQIFITDGGFPFINGSGTIFMTEVNPSDFIRFTYGGHAYTVTVQDHYFTRDDVLVISEAEYNGVPHFLTPVTYEIGRIDRYATTGAALETLKKNLLVGESKLWGDMRYTSYYEPRWAWAKCTKFSAPEKIDTPFAIPVEVEFYLREGVWWNEGEHSWPVTSASLTVPDVATLGNIPTPVRVVASAVASNITALDITLGSSRITCNATILNGTSLVIDTGNWSIMNNGVGCFNNLTVVTPGDRGRWLTLSPGVTGMTVVRTGGGTGSSVTAYWYDGFM
jgi:hypothetical protein